MQDMIHGLLEAFNMMFSFDRELYGIILLTLVVTCISTGISSLVGVPLGVIVGSKTFSGKKLITRIVNTLMGLPPVVAGLVVYLALSRKGPLGSFSLLFSLAAMVIAQVLIITPIIMGFTLSAVTLKSVPVSETCRGLGLKGTTTLRLLLHECKYPIFSAILAGYGRSISEVGAVMLVGGNIQHHTRVITTAIVLETGKGEYSRAFALGLILLVLSFLVNGLVQKLQEVP